MNKTIHPAYHQATISCACGNTFVAGSTKTEIRVELCSKCHPFYTGKAKFVDTARRVEKFQERIARTASAKAAHTGKTAKHAAKRAKRAAKLEGKKTADPQ